MSGGVSIFRALVCNDDGIWAPGIRALVDCMVQSGAEVYVCAPDGERSAISHALTMGSPIRVEALSINGAKGAWATTGTPADCVKIALEELLPAPPAIVVSGVNRGPNLGTDVLYSGTVAAAMEGAIAGLPAIAVSTADYDPADYSLAALAGAKIARMTVAHQGFPGVVLNVNVPDNADLDHIAVTRLGIQRYSDVFDRRVDPRGRSYYWLGGNPIFDDDGDADHDTSAVRRGMISVTPLGTDLTHTRTIELLRCWDQSL